MGRNARRLRTLAAELARAHPHVEDPAAYVSEQGVLVDGIVVDNPRSLVREGARIELRVSTPLRGETKLRAALDTFGVDVAGRVALDLGAAAGGFTRALLEAGASRVYAVDAGYGQLLGSLRQDRRVVRARTGESRRSRSRARPRHRGGDHDGPVLPGRRPGGSAARAARDRARRGPDRARQADVRARARGAADRPSAARRGHRPCASRPRGVRLGVSPQRCALP